MNWKIWIYSQNFAIQIRRNGAFSDERRTMWMKRDGEGKRLAGGRVRNKRIRREKRTRED